MGIIWVPKTRTKQPPVGTPIDWGNPLTRGLIFLMPFNDGPRNGVHNVPGPRELIQRTQSDWQIDPVSGSAGIVPRTHRRGTQMAYRSLDEGDVGNEVGLEWSEADTDLYEPDEITIMAHVHIDSAGSGRGRIISHDDGGTGDDYAIRLGDDGPNDDEAIFNWDTGTGGNVTLNLGAAGRAFNEQMLCARGGSDSATLDSWNLETNVLLSNSNTAFSGYTPTYATGGQLAVGQNHNVSNRSAFGDIYWVAMWNRQLTDAERDAVWGNFWQLFEPQAIPVFMPAAAVGTRFIWIDQPTRPRVVGTTILEMSGINPSGTVPLPANRQRGDILLLLVSCDGGRTLAYSSFTELSDTQNGANITGGLAWARAADVGSTEIITIQGGDDKATAICWLVRGMADPDKYPIQFAVTTGASTTPDPPSLVLDGQRPPGNRLFLSYAAMDGSGSITGFPAGYTDNQLTVAAGGAGSLNHGAVASRYAPLQSDNPGTFTASGSDEWVAFTIALVPGTIQVPMFVPGGAPAAPTFDAIAATKFMLRNFIDQSKVIGADLLSRVGVRPTDNTNKAADADALSRVAIRPLADASKAVDRVAISRSALRVLIDYAAGQVVNAVAILRAAIRPTQSASKAVDSQTYDRIAIRETSDTAKSAQAQALSRLNLRSIVAGVVAGTVNGIALMRLALRPTLDSNTSRTGQVLDRLGLRPTVDAATARTSDALQRMGLRVTAFGQVVGEFNGVAVSRLALRVLTDMATVRSGDALSRLNFAISNDYAKAIDGTGLSRIALRGLIDYVAGLVSFGQAHSRLALRALAAVTPDKVGVARDRLANRIAIAYTHSKTGLAQSGLAIRDLADGQKDASGIGYNRFGVRVLITSVPQGAIEILHTVELDGVFDPDRTTGGLFDFDIPLKGRAENP